MCTRQKIQSFNIPNAVWHGVTVPADSEEFTEMGARFACYPGGHFAWEIEHLY